MDNSVMDNASDMNQAPVEVATQDERMLPQSKVNELVGHARREAAEKAAARAVEDYKRQLQQESQPAQTSNAYANEEMMERKANEVLEKRKAEWEKQTLEKAQTQEAERIVKAYQQKIAQGAEKYEDFDAVTSKVNMGNYPNVVQLLAEYVDNSHDILYEISKNRTKLHQLESMCRDNNAQDAIYEMQRLSESIKSNEEAQAFKNSKSPLSQQRPSSTGTDSGPMTASDYRKKYNTQYLNSLYKK
jgi:hypothetical protein